MDVVINPVTQADVPFLWVMLTHAASMSPGGEASVAEAQADPYLRTYVDDWGRPDDLGVVAVTGDGQRVGAAWVRSGLIVAEPGVPELATAVVPSQRGQGVGAAMMRGWCAWRPGVTRPIILSVRENNPAVRFYERLGFRRQRELRNRVGGVSLVMRLAIAAP